jgi:hypothetical protein
MSVLVSLRLWLNTPFIWEWSRTTSSFKINRFAFRTRSASLKKSIGASCVVFLILVSPATAQLWRYTFQLQAFDNGTPVNDGSHVFITVAANDQEAASYAENALATWGQTLNERKISWNRMHAQPIGKTPVEPSSTPTAPSEPSSTFRINVLVYGWVTPEFHENQWAGTRGQSKLIEEFSVSLDRPISGVELEYMAHISNKGDTPWVKGGTPLRGDGERNDVSILGFNIGHHDPDQIEGIAFRLTGSNASRYVISYQAHLAYLGDTQWFKDGEFCGTKGQDRRLEAFRLNLSAK